MAEPVLTLDYSTADTLGIPEARAAFRLMLIVACLSGLCVGACFLAIRLSLEGCIVHAVVFAATIVVAIKAGRQWTKIAPERNTLQLALDALALCGLIMIAITPTLFAFLKSNNRDEQIGVGVLGVAYALLALTTSRHVMLYRSLATRCRQINRIRMARGLIVLGWFKAVYEFVWLGCCASALLITAMTHYLGVSDGGDVALIFAFGALFGVMGFAGVWVWMIGVHTQLLRLAK